MYTDKKYFILFYNSNIQHTFRFYPASAEMLLAAFRYFDKENRGYLTKEKFAQLMLQEGEPFTQVGSFG